MSTDKDWELYQVDSIIFGKHTDNDRLKLRQFCVLNGSYILYKNKRYPVKATFSHSPLKKEYHAEFDKYLVTHERLEQHRNKVKLILTAMITPINGLYLYRQVIPTALAKQLTDTMHSVEGGMSLDAYKERYKGHIRELKKIYIQYQLG